VKAIATNHHTANTWVISNRTGGGERRTTGGGGIEAPSETILLKAVGRPKWKTVREKDGAGDKSGGPAKKTIVRGGGERFEMWGLRGEKGEKENFVGMTKRGISQTPRFFRWERKKEKSKNGKD